MTDDYYQPTATDTPATPASVPTDDGATNTANEQDALEQLSHEDAESIVKKTTDSIVSALGLEGASEEQKKQVVETISQRILTAILKSIISNAPVEQTKPLVEKIANDTVNEQDVEKIINETLGLLEKVQNEVGLLYEKMLEEGRDVLEKITTDNSQTPVAQSDPIAAPVSVEKEIIDMLKSTGKTIDQNTVAEAVYQARMNNKLSPDVLVENLSEQERQAELAKWDWNKAGEILADENIKY